MLLNKVIFLLPLLTLTYALYEKEYARNAESEETESEETISSRKSKILSFIQVVRFPNDVCSGTSYNGTCYTSEQCSSKGGTSAGSCASGFGICCTFTPSCNTTSSENNTYLVQSSSTSITSPCNYKICPCNTNICRIRYDFNTLTLATPPALTALLTAETPSNAYGMCDTDAFSINNPGGAGSPIICGTNTGYHMILDSDGLNCQDANFLIGTTTTTTRAWTIRVTQYGCDQQDEAGPPGCLQYYTSSSNYIQNFGFPTGWSSGSATLTYMHLVNQHYNICVRRVSGYCYVCFNAAGSDKSAPTSTFSVSSSPSTTAAQGAIDYPCVTDYVMIPGGSVATVADDTSTGEIADNQYAMRICGRFFSAISADTNNSTVCTKTTPFMVGVHFDQYERCAGTADNTSTCELLTAPQGGVGFKLLYWQVSC